MFRDGPFRRARAALPADRTRSLSESLALTVVANPRGEALVCDHLHCDWHELAELAERLAVALAARDIAASDRVMLFLDNHAEFVIALFAVARLDPIVVRRQAPGPAYIVENCGASAILYEAGLADRIPALPIAIAVGD